MCVTGKTRDGKDRRERTKMRMMGKLIRRRGMENVHPDVAK